MNYYGEIVFDKQPVFLPKGSCTIISLNKLVGNSLTRLASKQINLADGVTKVIPYLFTVKKPLGKGKISLNASVNIGWCNKGSGSYKANDYISKESYDVQIRNEKMDYMKNIIVQCFGRYLT